MSPVPWSGHSATPIPHEKGTATMKLTTQTQVTVDGVMQGNGGTLDEDRRSGFERGGWALGAGDNETLAFITETYQRADAFLFGRRTYDLFSAYWGAMDPGSHPIADALNTTPKYLASPRSPTRNGRIRRSSPMTSRRPSAS